MKVFAYISAVIVIVAIGLGLYHTGFPDSARKEKADNVRISDLEQLYYSVTEYYNQEEMLPETFEDIFLTPLQFSQSIRTTDPETGEAYTYRRIDDTSFELCATFALANTAGAGYYGPQMFDKYTMPPFRIHGAGNVCFTAKVAPIKK